ncbi:response regulator [Corallococcus sp. H22C18031201]|uniref:response regulator n=1 Tax=Citreicoccus inhibens TaxID=2849499 RepID=UPI000E722DD3|nr:response regulator [Citreicoccus inhibens]MBU8895673.1 response regulator [Citreicoccus inhibens]RJS20266.1 response regulator [Corallococcus sp. H22C18031201]
MRQVLVLEDDDDLRGMLCDLLRMYGVTACVDVDSFEALVQQRDAALGCELALLDVNLGAGVQSGLDALDWLLAQAYRGRAVFLTGHARSHPLVRLAYEQTQVKVLAKPVDSRALRALLEEPRGA